MPRKFIADMVQNFLAYTCFKFANHKHDNHFWTRRNCFVKLLQVSRSRRNWQMSVAVCNFPRDSCRQPDS